MKKESEGKFKNFESAYNQVRESPAKPSASTIKKQDEEDKKEQEKTSNGYEFDDEIQNILDNYSISNGDNNNNDNDNNEMEEEFQKPVQSQS